MSAGWNEEQERTLASYEAAIQAGQRLTDQDRGVLDALRYTSRGFEQERRLELLLRRAKFDQAAS